MVLVNIKIKGVDEIPAQIPPNHPTNQLTVWLLSDVLLRDDWLQPTADIDVLIQTLANRLKVSLNRSDADSHLFARQRRTESWQTRWGLPRPSLVGLSAGSCLLLEVTEGKLQPELCREVELTGIGERCIEGYGQIALNADLLGEKVLEVTTTESSQNTQANPTDQVDQRVQHTAGEALNYACLIETAAWREAIRRSAQIVSAKEEIRATVFHLTITEDNRSQPSLSQLGGLRSQVMQLHQGKQNIKVWLQELKADKKWGADTANAFIELLDDRQKIWRVLDFASTLKLTSAQMTLTQGGEERLEQQLWAEAVQSLVVALTRAHKRKVEGLMKKALEGVTQNV